MPKAWKRLSPTEWLKIKSSFECDSEKPTCHVLADLYGISPSAVSKRAREENWQRYDVLAKATLAKVEAANEQIIQQTADKVTTQLSQQLADSLQPWLERQKTLHLKSQVKRARIALKQLDSHISPTVKLEPKESSFVAKAAETWDTIARRNLGLNDNTLPTGGLSLQILTNHAAVQVKPA